MAFAAGLAQGLAGLPAAIQYGQNRRRQDAYKDAIRKGLASAGGKMDYGSLAGIALEHGDTDAALKFQNMGAAAEERTRGREIDDWKFNEAKAARLAPRLAALVQKGDVEGAGRLVQANPGVFRHMMGLGAGRDPVGIQEVMDPKGQKRWALTLRNQQTGTTGPMTEPPDAAKTSKVVSWTPDEIMGSLAGYLPQSDTEFVDFYKDGQVKSVRKGSKDAAGLANAGWVRTKPDKSPAPESIVNVQMPDGTTRGYRKGDPRLDAALDAGGRVVSLGVQAATAEGLLGKKGKGTVEGKLIDVGEGLTRLNMIRESFKPEFLEYGTVVENWLAGQAEKLGVELSPERKAQVEEFTVFRQDTIDNLNRIIKEITGAQMSEAEAARIQKGIPNENDSPTQFKSKMDRTIQTLERASRRYEGWLKGGEVGKPWQGKSLAGRGLDKPTEAERERQPRTFTAGTEAQPLPAASAGLADVAAPGAPSAPPPKPDFTFGGEEPTGRSPAPLPDFRAPGAPDAPAPRPVFDLADPGTGQPTAAGLPDLAVPAVPEAPPPAPSPANLVAGGALAAEPPAAAPSEGLPAPEAPEAPALADVAPAEREAAIQAMTGDQLVAAANAVGRDPNSYPPEVRVLLALEWERRKAAGG